MLLGGNLDTMNKTDSRLYNDNTVRAAAKQIIREDICGRVRQVPFTPHSYVDEIVLEYSQALHC